MHQWGYLPTAGLLTNLHYLSKVFSMSHVVLLALSTFYKKKKKKNIGPSLRASAAPNMLTYFVLNESNPGRTRVRR